jgi:hypothetical protein
MKKESMSPFDPAKDLPGRAKKMTEKQCQNKLQFRLNLDSNATIAAGKNPKPREVPFSCSRKSVCFG